MRFAFITSRALLLLGLLGCREVADTDASGTIEVTQTDVAGSVPARVERVLVEEGAMVRAGDTLAVLSQTGLPQDITQRRERLAAAILTPIRRRLDYGPVGRRTFLVEPLPEGALPIYDRPPATQTG